MTRIIETGSFILLAVFVLGGTVYAQTPPPATQPGVTTTRAPAWQQDAPEVDFTAYRLRMQVPAVAVEVPTVVEVPFAGAVDKTWAVAKSSTGALSHVVHNTERVARTVTQRVTSESFSGTMFTSLSDGDVETYVDFPFIEGTTNTVAVIIDLDEAVESSTIQFSLPSYASSPTAVRVTALPTSEDASYADTRVLVSKRSLGSSRMVNFPVTEVERVQVEFFLSQPLRLADIKVQPASQYVNKTTGLRFLAQPGESYTLYLDPDRPTGWSQRLTTDLTSDEGVLLLDALPWGANPRYTPADIDEDGVPDARDNCVGVANPDQTDVNRNNVGDPCDDFDNDGRMNVNDNCENMPNPNQRDTDGDGVGDACDTEEDRFTEANPWVPWVGLGVAGVVLVGLLVATMRLRPEELHPEAPEVPQSTDELAGDSNEQ